MNSPNYDEIANKWSLWKEYVDTGSYGTEEEFDNMEYQEKIDFMIKCFGEEEERYDEYYEFANTLPPFIKARKGIVTLQQDSSLNEYAKHCYHMDLSDCPIIDFFEWYEMWCYENSLYSDISSSQIDEVSL